MSGRLIRDGLRRGMGEVTYSAGARQSECTALRWRIPTGRASRQLAGSAVHDCKNHRRRARNPAQGGAKDETRCSRLFPALRQSPLPISIPISTAHRGASLRMFSVHRTAFRASRATPAPARQRRSPSSAPPLETQGYAVEGFAPTSRAARQLGEAGVDTGTLQGFLARGTNREAPEKKHFYFVDESSLASTNQMREFLGRLGPQDRVLADRRHAPAPGRRSWSAIRATAAGRNAHCASRRNCASERSCTQDPLWSRLRKGMCPALSSCSRSRAGFEKSPTPANAFAQSPRSYVESPEKTLIVSPDNASRRELNVAVREELKAKGTLAPEDHQFKVLVQRQEMTGAERRWASGYEIGDVVRYARGSKAAGIEAGTYGTVVGMNPATNLLSVEHHPGMSSPMIRAA